MNNDLREITDSDSTTDGRTFEKSKGSRTKIYFTKVKVKAAAVMLVANGGLPI